MTDRITIFGYGPVGRATAARLLPKDARSSSRNGARRADLPKGATFAPCDALDRDAVVKAVRGAGQFVVAIGFPYSGVLWREVWPKAIANFVAACKATGARMVFIDNLYMYGPQTAPLVETMPLSDKGWKPAARSAATRVWMAAAAAGEARVAALRAPDFYGPGVGNSFLGDTSIGKLAQGKARRVHRLAGRAARLRLCAGHRARGDDASGRAGLGLRPGLAHALRADPDDARHPKIAADTLGVKLRISAMPAWMLGASGMFSPFLRELQEMRFQWDRPYHVDASRFAAAFWSDVTPFETGVPETALAFRAALKRRR